MNYKTLELLILLILIIFGIANTINMRSNQNCIIGDCATDWDFACEGQKSKAQAMVSKGQEVQLKWFGGITTL